MPLSQTPTAQEVAGCMYNHLNKSIDLESVQATARTETAVLLDTNILDALSCIACDASA